jgi:hypothetical protein
MIACATHSVTASASVILRLAFSARSGRRSSAVHNTAISSRFEVGEHRGPQRSTARIGTADFDPLRYVSFDPGRAPRAVELLI